ncbi:MAG: hypothetical protein MUF72_15780 [Elainella sp. Prado103]|jgi:hypothetical protein|nr:hypothetical protein [Elainella sp. Prado103]
MTLSPLPPDDQPAAITPFDRALLLQLEQVVSQHFYFGCDRITQALLARCWWSITMNLDMPTLTIACPDSETYWNMVSHIKTISEYLVNTTHISRIEVIPQNRKNLYFQVEVGT